MAETGALLEVQDLKVYYPGAADRGGPRRPVRAVDGVSLALGEDETLGLVGESGSGKTTLIKAVLRLLPAGAQVASGRVLWRGRDLLTLPRRELRRLRWRELALISQSAMNSLDPVYRVGAQIAEAILAHEPGRHRAQKRAGELLSRVGLQPSRARDYPHQLSGGMKQRVAIAMAIALDPALIVADEPTTALDVIVQAQILDEILRLLSSRRGSLILVTHDISVVAQTCRRVAVMYAGRIVEQGETAEVFERPAHPYTMGLKNAFPSISGERRGLVYVPGFPPDPADPPPGCRFAPRCPFSQPACGRDDPPTAVLGGRQVACHLADDADRLRRKASEPSTWRLRAPAGGPVAPPPPEGAGARRPGAQVPRAAGLDRTGGGMWG
ncbi:MAG: ABC transporter ATP-binding protein [Acetobacteraceae bacterium]|nr:ABC transporter ATP-binding protein [Acetobacteraceae bacterium]